MLYPFLNAQKPIQYIALMLYALGLVLVYSYIDKNATSILGSLTTLLLILASVLLCLFIDIKNKLSQSNSYFIFLFVSFMLFFLFTDTASNKIWAHFFLLLSLRRIISFRSNKNIKKKIFDAGLWIAFAAYFDFWTILFFIPLYYNILTEAISDLKNLWIPIISTLAAFTLLNFLSLLLNNAFYLPSASIKLAEIQLSDFDSYKLLLFVAVLFLMSFANTISKIISKQAQNKAKLLLKRFNVLLLITIALIIVLSFPNHYSSFVYFAFPLAITGIYFLESPINWKIKEAMLWVILFLPLLPFFI